MAAVHVQRLFAADTITEKIRECIRQTQMRRELCAVVRAAQYPQERRCQACGLGDHTVTRVARRKILTSHPSLQFHHLLRKTLGRIPVGVQQLRCATIAAGCAAKTQVYAPGGQRVQHAKLFGHFERRVMRQHDTGAAQTYARGAGGNCRQ